MSQNLTPPRITLQGSEAPNDPICMPSGMAPPSAKLVQNGGSRASVVRHCRSRSVTDPRPKRDQSADSAPVAAAGPFGSPGFCCRGRRV